MLKSGPILIVEDDIDDETFIKQALKELNLSNPIICFKQTKDAFQFLKATKEQPFIIISDINLPGNSGLQLKRDINNDSVLRKKCIPFLFYSTSSDQETINEAYTQMIVQGFFPKATSYAEIKKTIKVIVEYWQICLHPVVHDGVLKAV